MQKNSIFLQTIFKILRENSANRNVTDFQKRKIYKRIPESS